jgi:DNA excision repair protein ERCC-2
MNLFPYSTIRPEQDALLKEIRSAVDQKHHLIVHAPTGLGKTVAALVPSVEYALENNLTVFFLTSRHTQHAIAVETLKEIQKKHKEPFHVANLVGKKNMCLQEGVANLRPGEFYEYCKKLREENRCEHYTNTKQSNKNTPHAEVLLSTIKQKGALHTEQIIDECKEELMCPYEIVTSLAKDSTVVITDYSYIFNPAVNSSLFKRMQKSLGQCIVIIDEAHNLPRRIVESATERLTMFVLKRAVQDCNKYGYTDTAVKLTTLMDLLTRSATKEERLMAKEEFISLVEQIQNYQQLINELHGIADDIIVKQQQTFVSSVAEFLVAWLGEDFGFTRILSTKDKKIVLTYRCLDPAAITREIIKNTHCTIAMSGTLTPTDMYRDLLGFENVIEKEFTSPFPEENKLSLIVPKTTTKYTERNEEQFRQIAETVSEITNTVPGNSVVFFPSYAIRDNVYRYLMEKSDKTTMLEAPEMSKQEKTDMLQSFKSYAKTGAVLLGATSGNFSEGIDLMGDLLKCVVIVGLPLQQPDLETQESIKYYDAKFGKGWDYGYLFPAFNKVLQGAGRCIRSETDRGVIVYLDERFSWPQYLRCFPEDMNLKIKKDHIAEIKEFFSI